MFDRWLQRALTPCDPSGLAVFRFALGLSVAWFALETLTTPSLAVDYIQPTMHLTFSGFDWVGPWPGEGMTIHFVVLLAASVGFALGLCYRLSAVVMLVAFTHVFLIERTLYNNHYYLTILLALLSCFMPLDRGWSLDALRREGPPLPPPRLWCVWLLQFQIGVVYFFGGIAKLDTDWLHGQPMRMWLAAKSHLPVFGSWLTEDWVVNLFVWGGLLLDLLAVPCLMWRRTRPAMFAALVVFHLINSQLFTIGYFPWLMLPATALFFPPDWPRRLLRRAAHLGDESPVPEARWTAARKLGLTLVGIYVAMQCLVPLRHLAWPGNPSWTEQGQLFAWRMMLRQKTTAIRFHGVDPAARRQGVIDIRPFLNQRQLAMMSRDPDLIVQFAQKLAALHARHGVANMEIRVKALVSLNGRRPQLLIDPNVDLTSVNRSGRDFGWIMPLTEPFRRDAWSVPVSDWERVLAQESSGRQSHAPEADAVSSRK